MLIRIFQNRSIPLARWLGLCLAVFVLYGTTVEAAHRHGLVTPDSGSASFVDRDQSAAPVSGKVGCSDCLICQLHQNFNTTPLALRLVDPPQQICIKVADTARPKSLSLLIGPTAGRAPPALS